MIGSFLHRAEETQDLIDHGDVEESLDARALGGRKVEPTSPRVGFVGDSYQGSQSAGVQEPRLA